jgi:hypothetical protein
VLRAKDKRYTQALIKFIESGFSERFWTYELYLRVVHEYGYLLSDDEKAFYEACLTAPKDRAHFLQRVTKPWWWWNKEVCGAVEEWLSSTTIVKELL